MLTLEETGFTKEAATWIDSAMIASLQSTDSFVPKSNSDHTHNRRKQSGNRKTGSRKSKNAGGRGSSGGQGGSSGGRTQQQ